MNGISEKAQDERTTRTAGLTAGSYQLRTDTVYTQRVNRRGSQEGPPAFIPPHQRLRARRLWLGIFMSWGFFLTGGALSLARLGPPGAIQAWRLRSLLTTREEEVRRLKAEIQRVGAERGRMEHSKVAIEREIRRTLGYAAPDEIIFDFTASERNASLGLSASGT